MIHSISFNKYKSFKDKTELVIKPITILVGPNSSGKSSITKLFGLLHQSFYDVKKKDLLLYIGKDVDLGSFKNISYRNMEREINLKIILDQYDHFLPNSIDNIPKLRDTTAKLLLNIARSNQEVEYEFKDYSIDNDKQQNGKIKIVGSSDNFEIKYDDLHLIQIEPEELVDGRLIKDTLEYFDDLTLDDTVHNLLHWDRKNINNLLVEIKGLSFKIVSDYIQSDRPFNFPQKRVDYIVNLTKGVLSGSGSGNMRLDEDIRYLVEEIKNNPDYKGDHNDLDEIIKYYLSYFVRNFFNRKRDGFVRVINNFMNPTIEGNIKGIDYHGPIRSIPKKSYAASEIMELLSTDWPIPKSFKEQLENEISKNLRDIGQKTRFMFQRIGSDYIQMVIEDEIVKSKHNLTDVGFGLSQIIPIFISIEKNRKENKLDPLIVIEQPELHLHPQAQAYMSNIFYNGLLFNGKRNRSKFVLETHSEHLIRGFQVLVAKKKLSPDDIAIYYIEKNNRGNSIVKNMPIDEQGFFTESWPEGFFDQAYRQTVELISGTQ